MPARRLDLFAVAACLLTAGMLATYVSLVRSQGDSPAPWAVAVLVVGVLGAAYSSFGVAPYGHVVLVLCGVLLAALGALAILSIGLPILLAAALCLAAFVRRSARGGPAS